MVDKNKQGTPRAGPADYAASGTLETPTDSEWGGFGNKPALCEVRIWSQGNAIYGLQCCWVNEKREKYEGSLCGSRDGSQMTLSIDVLGGEYLTDLRKRSGLWLDMIELQTSRMNLASAGALGGGLRSSPELSAPMGGMIIGFHGLLGFRNNDKTGKFRDLCTITVDDTPKFDPPPPRPADPRRGASFDLNSGWSPSYSLGGHWGPLFTLGTD